MDLSREALLDELNDFEKKRPNDITPVLEDYLLKIAKCGDTMFPWSKFKLLIRKKLEVVMSDFHEGCPTDNLSTVPNVELFKFDSMKCKILEAVDSFQSTPFTIQRLCELLTSPKKHYKRTDKFMRGIEKNILVVSTIEPRHAELINNNGSLVVNGILEVSTEGEMLVSSQKDVDNENNFNNTNNSLFIQQERVTVNGVPLPEGLFTTDPSSSSCSNGSANLGSVPEMESSSEDSSDSSTDSSADYTQKESSLEVMTDVTSSQEVLALDMAAETIRSESLVAAAAATAKDESSTHAAGTAGTMEEADAVVQEETRLLLSQVAANIEESSIMIDSSEDAAKFPITIAIMDTSGQSSGGHGPEATQEQVPSKLSDDHPNEVSLPVVAAASTLGCSPADGMAFPQARLREVNLISGETLQMEEAVPTVLATACGLPPVPSAAAAAAAEGELPIVLDTPILSGDTNVESMTEVALERMETESCLSLEQSLPLPSDLRRSSLEAETHCLEDSGQTEKNLLTSALETPSPTAAAVLAFDKSRGESKEEEMPESEPGPKQQPSEEPMDQD